MLLHTGISC